MLQNHLKGKQNKKINKNNQKRHQKYFNVGKPEYCRTFTISKLIFGNHLPEGMVYKRVLRIIIHFYESWTYCISHKHCPVIRTSFVDTASCFEDAGQNFDFDHLGQDSLFG